MFKARNALLLVIVLLFGVALLYGYTRQKTAREETGGWREGAKLTPLSQDVHLEEVSREESPTSGWWLNSGGIFTIVRGIGKTNQGNLPAGSKWAKAYAAANPLDTDRGLQPQNILRLIYRNQWQNYEQEGCFQVNRYNLSQSENRNQSNGFFFLNRYRDGDNLYYTGLRVDGEVVIKKKQNGIYTTLGSKKIVDGIYNRGSNPNLIPVGRWLGLKSRVLNINNEANIELWTDLSCRGEWTSRLKVTDSESPILETGDVGIRGDFMDMEFKNYRLLELLRN